MRTYLMGHLFLVCGPPGSGKTTLLKRIRDRKIQITQLRRLTTRSPRKEEGDKITESLEYYFRTPEQFAEQLSRGKMANLVEWNGNYYATQVSELDKSRQTDKDYVLLEDIPSGIAIKEKWQANATVILVFTTDVNDLLDNMVFSSHNVLNDEFYTEWRRRLGLKYDNYVRMENREPIDLEREEYVKIKIDRANLDLAFALGKIRDNYEIRVLANHRDKVDETVNAFVAIMHESKNNKQIIAIDKPKESGLNINNNTQEKSNNPKGDDIDPSKLKLGDIIRNMTAAQLWKILAILAGVISLLTTTAYKIGKGIWP